MVIFDARRRRTVDVGDGLFSMHQRQKCRHRETYTPDAVLVRHRVSVSRCISFDSLSDVSYSVENLILNVFYTFSDVLCVESGPTSCSESNTYLFNMFYSHLRVSQENFQNGEDQPLPHPNSSLVKVEEVGLGI